MSLVDDLDEANKGEIPSDEQFDDYLVASIDEQLIKVRALQQQIVFQSVPAAELAGVLGALVKLPVVTGFMRTLTGTSGAIVKFADADGLFTSSVDKVKSGFSYSSLALAIVDFFRIPAISLAAWQLGQKDPLKLSDKARWVYASLLLTLSIISLSIPATSPVIAIVTGVSGLGVSIYSLWEFFELKYTISKELQQTVDEFAQIEQELAALKGQAAQNEPALQAAFMAGDYPLIKQLTSDIDSLHQQFEQKRDILQKLYDKKIPLEQKKQLQGTGVFLDKSVGVGLSSLGLIGVTVSLFFPLTGLGILAASGTVGSLYVVGRLAAIPLGYLFERNTTEQETQQPASLEQNEGETNELANQLSDAKQRERELANESVSQSTTNLLRSILHADKRKSDPLAINIDLIPIKPTAKKYVPLESIAEEDETHPEYEDEDYKGPSLD